MSDKYIQLLAGKNLIVAGCNLKVGDIVSPSHPRYNAILKAIPLAARHVATKSEDVKKGVTRILVTEEDDLLDIRHETLEDRFPNLNGPDPSKLLAIEMQRNLDIANGVLKKEADELAAEQIAALSDQAPSSTVRQPRVVEVPEGVKINPDPKADEIAAVEALAQKRKLGRPKKDAAKAEDKAPDAD